MLFKVLIKLLKESCMYLLLVEQCIESLTIRKKEVDMTWFIKFIKQEY
jgi:hypothetical protein